MEQLVWSTLTVQIFILLEYTISRTLYPTGKITAVLAVQSGGNQSQEESRPQRTIFRTRLSRTVRNF